MKGGNPTTTDESLIEINNYLEQYKDTNVYVEEDEFSLRDFVVKGMFKSGEVLDDLNELNLTSKKDYVYKFVTTILPQTIALLSGNKRNYGDQNAFQDENLSTLKDDKLLIDFMEEMLYAYLNKQHSNLPDIYDEKCLEVQARCCKEREDMLNNLFIMNERMKQLQLKELEHTMKGICKMNQTTDSVAYSEKLADTVAELVDKATEFNRSVAASAASSPSSPDATSVDTASSSSPSTGYSTASFDSYTSSSATSASSVSTASSYQSATESPASQSSVFGSPLASAPTPVDITKDENGVDLFAIEIFNKAADAVQKDYKEKLENFKKEQQLDNESKVEDIKEIIEILLDKTFENEDEKKPFKVSDQDTTFDAVFTKFISLVELLFTKVGKQREELEQKLTQYKNANNDLYKFIQKELPGLEANENENEGLAKFIERVERAEQDIGEKMEKIVSECPKITDKQFEKCQKEIEALKKNLDAEKAKFATTSDQWEKAQQATEADATAKHATEMEALRTEMAALAAANTTVETEKGALNQQIAEKQELLKQKEEEVTRLIQEVAQEKRLLEDQKVQCEATVQGKDTEISTLNNRLKEVNTQSLDNDAFVQRLETEHAAKEKQCKEEITNLMAEKTTIGEELTRVTKAHEKQLNDLRTQMGADTQEEKRNLLQNHESAMAALQKKNAEIEVKLREQEDERRRLQQAEEETRNAELERARENAYKQEQINACLHDIKIDESKVVPPITERDFNKTVEKLMEVDADTPVDIASVTINNSDSKNEVVKNLKSFWKTYGMNTFNNEKPDLIQLLTLILNKTCNGTKIELPDLLNNKRFSYLFTILSVFILKKFEIFVGAFNKSDNSPAFKCMTQKDCVTQTINIGGKSYEYDNVYLPMGNDKQYYVSATEDCKAFDNKTEYCNSLYNVREITGLIDRFTTETGTNNYLLFNYGFSGTGKTNVANGIIRLLKEKSKLAEIKITHGVLGKFLSPEEGFKVNLKDGKSAKSSYGRKFGRNKYSDLDMNSTFSVAQKSFDTVDAFKEQSTVKNTVDFDMYKETMNNQRSSRFHMYYKFTHEQNTLYFFDLAGSENSGDIFTHELKNYTNKLSETDIVNTLLGSKDSVYTLLTQPANIVNQLAEDHVGNKSYIVQSGKYTDLFRFLTGEKFTTTKMVNGRRVINTDKKLVGNLKTIKEKFKIIDGDAVRRKLHILLESFYINYSLHTLQNELMNYNGSSEYKLNAVPAMGLPNELQDVKKIYMFGFIRNDKLDGAKDTLDFLDKLKPMMGSHPLEENKAAKPIPSPIRGGGFLATAAYVGTKGDDEVYDLMANATMDRETTTWFVEVIAIVVLKILRVMYYEKAGNSGRTNEQFVQTKEYYHHMMKEYVATLSLSAGLYLAGRTRMFYAVMTDLIMSAMIMLMTKNDKLTMFPLFLVVYLA